MDQNRSFSASAPERELVMTCVFHASRELVFKARADPEHSKRWSGPRGFTATHVEQDPRPGGDWRLCLREDETGRELWQGGVFREIVEPECLVFTFAWDSEDGRTGHETLITITFEEHVGKTKMTFHQGVFKSIKSRDGHEGGWKSAFDRLAEQLAKW